MFRFVLLLAFVIDFQRVHAHPTTMGTISGEQVKLQTIGHSFAGSIKHRIVLGRKLPGEFVSEIKIVDQDYESLTVFKHNNSQVFGGEIKIESPHAAKSLAVELIELRKNENTYVMSFNGLQSAVMVHADGFEDGHFINPEYSMEYLGKLYQFKLEGQACYGYSLHLIAMIMGSLIL